MTFFLALLIVYDLYDYPRIYLILDVPESSTTLSLCASHIFISVLHCYGSRDVFSTAPEQVLIPFSSSLSAGESPGKASINFL